LDAKTTISKVQGWTLLVRLDPIEKTVNGGLIELPAATVLQRELGQIRATVLDIADSAWSDEIAKGGKARCAVGDHILFREYAGVMLDVEGPDKYRIINDKDVYAVLEPL
jgi:co-chaperonin GroES (HSP10)